MRLRRTHNFLKKICSRSRRRAPQVSADAYPLHSRREAGVTLLDTVVGTALMLVIFVGIYGAFRLSVDVVTNNKARAGAISLASERMEYIRSLSYADVGTVGGVPAGAIPQSEAVTLNGVAYTRRTFITYVDDPSDGIGAADTDGITEDYKAAKVDVSWNSRTGVRSVELVTRIEPQNGVETACTPPCGTLSLAVVNASSTPLSGASVSITNPSTTPAVSVNTFTNTDGQVMLLGAPAASGYHVVVTEPGYSTAETYSATAENTDPNPADLTVSNNQTTSGTFAIDVLGTITVRSWTPVQSGAWTDPFADTSKVATTSNVTVGGGSASLQSGAAGGSLQSVAIAPAYLYGWQSLSWSDSQPSGSSIAYHVYDSTGSTLIPDTVLPGNAAGFTSSPVDLSGISTTTYPGLRIAATLTGSGSSVPAIDSWSVGYEWGPQPLPNVPFSVRGAKTIGSGPNGTVYKFSQSFNTGSAAAITIPDLEWDSYIVSVASTTGYDIASSCEPQPQELSPGASLTNDLYLTAHTANSLLVDVRSAATSALVPGAQVELQGTNYDAMLTTGSCGQAYFGGLTAGTYTLTASSTGSQIYTSTVNVTGTAQYSVALN